VLHCDVSFRCIAPVRENAPKFCAPTYACAARSRCDLPSPRPADRTTSTGSDTGSGQRIQHVLRIVCRRLVPWCRLGHETHRNAPLSRSRAGGIYPNPRRPENVALKGSFCVGLLPAPRGLLPVAPLPSCPLLLPSAAAPAAAAGATRCPPCCPRVPRSGWSATVNSGRDRPTRPTPDQPDQSRSLLVRSPPFFCHYILVGLQRVCSDWSDNGISRSWGSREVLLHYQPG
jgi:hypothetical protein